MIAWGLIGGMLLGAGLRHPVLFALGVLITCGYVLAALGVFPRP